MIRLRLCQNGTAPCVSTPITVSESLDAEARIALGFNKDYTNFYLYSGSEAAEFEILQTKAILLHLNHRAHNK
jgi:hypothetical protein